MIDIEGDEFNVEACIQFTLLQKILIRMAKREKSMKNKIEELEEKLAKLSNINDIRLQNIENNIVNLSQNKPIDTIEIKSIIEKYDAEVEKEKEKKKKEKEKENEKDESNEKKTKRKKNKKIEENEEEEEESYEEKKPKKRKNKKIKEYDEEEEEESNEEKKPKRKKINKESENEEEESYEEKKLKRKKRKKDSEEEDESYEIKKPKKKRDDSYEKGKDSFEEGSNRKSKKYYNSASIRTEEDSKSDNQEEEIERIISNLPNNFGLEHKEEKLNEPGNSYKINTFPELLTLFNKRIHQCEKKIKELFRISKIHNMLSNGIRRNKDNLEESNNEIENLKKSVRDLEIRAKQSKNEMDQIRVKVEDFNVYDLFKDAGDGNLDASKVLIMALEKKVFKKFEQNDERAKGLEEDVFKSKNISTNAMNSIKSIKKDIENNKKSNEDLIKELNNYKNETLNEINNINTRLNNLGNDINNNNSNIDFDEEKINSLINKSINDLEDKIMQNINKLLGDIKSNSLQNNNPTISEENLKLLNDLSKKVSDLRKEITTKSDLESIDELNEKLKKIYEELNTKTNKFSFEELNDRVNNLEDKSKDDDYQMEQVNEALDKLRQENSMMVRKIEYLTGQYSKLAFGPVSDNSKNRNSTLLDLAKYVDNQKFIETNKIIYSKFDHLKSLIENIQRNIDDILERLKHTPTEDDFTQYQNLLKAMLEDLRLSCNKKYADKIDVQKSFRYIETQIKNIQENYKREGETWLLAKKPISNFLCASCESVIKDMNIKSEYVPWNKYPQREESTKYRMGHGFSRMLQMVNTDLLKSQELKENGKNYASDDEKIANSKDLHRIGSTLDKKVKLPHVGSRGFNNNNNLISNNSNVNNKSDNNNNQINVHNNISFNNNILLSPRGENNQNNDNINQPKVIKIYKINKQNNNTNTAPNNNNINNSVGNGNNDGDSKNFYNSTEPNNG